MEDNHFYLITFSEVFSPYISLLAGCARSRIEYKPIPLSTIGLIREGDVELLLVKMLGHRDDLKEILFLEAEDFETVTWSSSIDLKTTVNIHLLDREGDKSRLTYECAILQVAQFEENLVPEALLTHEKPSIRNFIKKSYKRYKGH